MFEKYLEKQSENPLLEKELRQEDLPKRLRFSVNNLGRIEEVGVEYKIKPERIIGTCGECLEENKVLFREKVSGEPKVQSSNEELTLIAQEKIRSLVEGVENEMLCCENCFTEEFMKKRPGMYLQAMGSVSKKLGISIDLDGLKEAVLGGRS
ncbi:MAG: hypothetical protein WCG84_04160 [Candidatus Moraniibacteriota bacterium]